MNADSRAAAMTTSEEVHGIVQTISAALIALTAVEAVLLFVNQSRFSNQAKIFTIHYGEWLLLPACAFVGVIARPLGMKGILAVLGAFATSFALIKEFRGIWIWDGTFDHFAYSSWPWIRMSLIGLIIALGLSAYPRRGPAKGSRTWSALAALSVCLAMNALLPRFWPNDSEFVSTRWIAVAAALVVLSGFSYFAWRDE